jgi:hypothetical protein
MAKRNSLLSMTLAATGLVGFSVLGVWAQVQTSPQQACLNAVNKNGAAVAKTQGKENVGCVKAAGKTGPTGAQACLTLDAKGKVAKAKGKTTAAETKSCGTPPSFGYTSAAAANTAAQQASLDLTADVYGANLDAALVSCTTDKAKCACQQKVSKDVEALAAVKFATFVGCKKSALKAGANASAALANCVSDGGTVGSIAADSKGKIAKSIGKLNADIVKVCDTPGVTGAFPGDCTALSGAALGTCLDTQVECRVCQAINEMDGLFVNCDAFDNGALDASCASGTGPTPTPTATSTPQPTATPTFQPGTIIQGFLPRSNGFWSYGGNPGLPGGETLCNATFPGTHVCTVTNLLAAETAGELVGAADNLGAIIRFWKIDPGETNLRQCIDPTNTLRWRYATADTPSRGIYLSFSAPSGDLGAESGLVSCPGNQASVGCCL